MIKSQAHLLLLVELLQRPLAPLESVNLRDQSPLIRKLEVAPGELRLQPLDLVLNLLPATEADPAPELLD